MLFGVLVERVEVILRLLIDLGRRHRARRVLGNHQGRGIERRLHGGPGVVDAGIVDRAADRAHNGDQGDCEHRGDVAGLGAAETRC